MTQFFKAPRIPPPAQPSPASPTMLILLGVLTVARRHFLGAIGCRHLLVGPLRAVLERPPIAPAGTLKVGEADFDIEQTFGVAGDVLRIHCLICARCDLGR